MKLHKKPKSIEQIISEVAAKHGFEYVEMLSTRKGNGLISARYEAYHRCIKETPWSLPVIGKHFGNRDHSTITKGAKKYELTQAKQ